MLLLSGFLEVLFKAMIICGLSLAIGGLVFALLVIRPLNKASAPDPGVMRRLLLASAGGALLLAISQCLAIVIEPWSLADDSGRWPIYAFLRTTFAQAGMLRVGFCLCLAWFFRSLAKRPESRRLWTVAVTAAIFLVASGAWQVHAVSRLQNALPLMALTVLHQLGGALWVGGVVNLAILWHYMRGVPVDEHVWPALLERFSPLAMLSVGIVCSTGICLSINYIGDWGGLFGTAYGAMVLTKTALLAVALCLGAMNFLNIRQWKQGGDLRGVRLKLPGFVEAEAGTVIIILMAAAALTSQPPALDVIAERATPGEVLNTFAPRLPQLHPPPYQEMLSRAASSLDLFSISGTLDRIQSNFNHNMAGIFVLLTGLFAMLYRSGKFRWARHWPLLFLLLALFLLLLAEPNGWPLGYEGFWETLISPGVLQHRLATLLVIVLALFEWRVNAGTLINTRCRFVFPILCAVGGALLLTHSHSPFVSKWAFLIEVSHNAIGFLAVLMGVGRWLELRLPAGGNRLPGFLWPVCMVLIGFVLIFYREV